MDEGSGNKARANASAAGEAPAGKPVSDAASVDRKSLEEKIFELVSYMTVSARNLLDEPARYGPFRLVDSVSRLVDILEANGLSSGRLAVLQENIERLKYSAMGPEEEYRAFLEGLVSLLVDEIGRQAS
jgi:hypothetical protein